MAEAFFNHYAAGKAVAVSAGTDPASRISQTAVDAMREVGLDISGQQPKKLTPEMLDGVDRVITMGCGVEGVCPASFTPAEDWQLDDPKGKPMEQVREIRDKIEAKVKKLIAEVLYEVR